MLSHKDCVKINRIVAACFVITFFFTISIFIAPFMVGSGEIKNLDGNAWKIDYRNKWDSMPLFPRLIYYFGDINCHQKYYRSYYLNENQMPVCARDTGMLAGLSSAFFLFMFLPGGKTIKSTAVNLLCNKIKDARKIFLLFLILLAPAIIDGFLQLLTSYESTNELRFATGFFMGISIAFFASILFLTDPRISS